MLSTTIVVISLFFNWKMALASVWVMPVAFIIVISSRRVMTGVHEKTIKYRLDCIDSIQEGFKTLRDLRSYNMTKTYSEGLNKKIKAVEKHAIFSEFANAAFV